MSDSNNILDGINNTIVEDIDRHAPLLTKTITVKQKQPWLTHVVKGQKRVVRKKKKDMEELLERPSMESIEN